MAAELSLVEAIKLFDSLAVAGVLGLVLRWALKRIELKDQLIADLANRSAAAIERVLEYRSEGKGDG